jgi:hypothetical protein
MSLLDLVFDGKAYPVAKKSVFELLEHLQLFQATSYAVQSSVPPDVFQSFVDFLTSQKNPVVTRDNALPLSLLAKEFFLPELASECSAFLYVSADQFSRLSDRVSELERQISSLANPSRTPDEAIESHEQQLENLRLDFERLKKLFDDELTQLKTTLEEFQTRSPEPPSSSGPPRTEVDFPMPSDRSVDGIIAYLTQQHGGNVDDLGIVTITSKSVIGDDPQFALRNVADLRSDWFFHSQNAPGQWVCWDFHGIRIRPTHYTMEARALKSWVVEGSLDGANWTEMDRRTDNRNFKLAWRGASFAVANPVECRFIRLTATDNRPTDGDHLLLLAVEFFGRLAQ